MAQTMMIDGKEYTLRPVRNTDKCKYNQCDGDGHLTWQRGVYQTVSFCECWFDRKASQRFFATVGERDQWVKLRDLRPCEKSKLPMSTQQKCIDAMRADPGGNYAMLGASGTSKTTYAVALYRRCLAAHRYEYQNIIRIKAKELLETIQAYRYDDNFKPDRHIFTHAKKITNLAARGYKTHLFLEELEKVKYTENRSSEMFDIVDALYETNGQLVVTGNLTFEDLKDTTKFPEGFSRRVDELCKHRWDFWKYAQEEVKA